MINKPNDFVIVPKVPSDTMLEAMYNSKNMWPNAHCDNRKELIRSESAPKYYAAISAAPPHNLVAVDKGELRTLKGAYKKIMQISTIEELQSLQSVLAAFYPNLGAK